MATYATNTTIKISAAISATNTYSVPANSYAIVQCFFESGGAAGVISVGGVGVWNYAGTNAMPGGTGVNPDGIGPLTFYVGPGQTITRTGGATMRISGVQFINTP